MEILFIYFLMFVALALYVLTKHLLNKIQNLPPSPFLCLPIIGHLYLLKKPLYRTLSKVSKRKGPVVLLQFGSRRVLVVSSPSAAEECLTKNDVVFANRLRLLIGKHMGYNYTSLSWASYGEHWRNLRRISSLKILSSTRLQMLSGFRVDEVRSLVRRLFHDQTLSVDLRTAIFELTMNVMMRMIAGKPYYGENVSKLEEAKLFKEIHLETFKLSSALNIGDYLPWIKSRELEKKLIKSCRKRDDFMQELIEEHRRRMASDRSNEKSKTMIEVLLESQQTDPDYYTDNLIKSLMLVPILAGTDTSINTLEWALSLLLNNPEELKKAQTELDHHIGYDRLICESDIAKLPHLRNIINETLRMYPAGPLLGPHESSEECTVEGFRIPRGIILLVNCWGIQNDPNIWEDPRKFKPGRFGGIEVARDGFKLMPFGSGRRGCPGEGLGLRMVGLTLGTLIQCFDWKRIGEEMVDMTEKPGITLSKLHPLKASWQPRPAMINLLSHI